MNGATGAQHTSAHLAVVPTGTGGQRTSVLAQHRAALAVSHISGMDMLRQKMQQSVVGDEDGLEDRVGKLINQHSRLILVAGQLLAAKISQSPGIGSHTINAIVEIGSGKYHGLGLALSLGLVEIAKTSNVKIQDDHMIFCHTWGDDQVSPLFKELRSIKIIVVMAAKTAENTVKLNAFIDMVKGLMNTNADFVVKICSLVCLQGQDESIQIDSNAEKYLHGTKVSY